MERYEAPSFCSNNTTRDNIKKRYVQSNNGVAALGECMWFCVLYLMMLQCYLRTPPYPAAAGAYTHHFESFLHDGVLPLLPIQHRVQLLWDSNKQWRFLQIDLHVDQLHFPFDFTQRALLVLIESGALWIFFILFARQSFILFARQSFILFARQFWTCCAEQLNGRHGTVYVDL